MATGDAAQAAGYPLVAATDDKRLGYDEINKTRDLIATVGTSLPTWARPATTAASARNSLGITATNIPTSTATVQADIDYISGRATTALEQSSGKANQNDLNNVYLGYMSPDIYNRILSTAYRATYVRSDGVLGHVPSSRRFKKNIRDAVLGTGLLRSIRLRVFQYKASLSPDPDAWEVGTIAEELDELGLTWLVSYDEEGKPFSVHYDRLSLAALALAQQAHDRTDDLERRLTALEGANS